jgi:hypothetical protein
VLSPFVTEGSPGVTELDKAIEKNVRTDFLIGLLTHLQSIIPRPNLRGEPMVSQTEENPCAKVHIEYLRIDESVCDASTYEPSPCSPSETVACCYDPETDTQYSRKPCKQIDSDDFELFTEGHCFSSSSGQSFMYSYDRVTGALRRKDWDSANCDGNPGSNTRVRRCGTYTRTTCLSDSFLANADQTLIEQLHLYVRFPLSKLLLLSDY